jgi:hypothetical protein
MVVFNSLQITSMTATLMVISFVFLFFNIPSDVYFISFAKVETNATNEHVAAMFLFFAVVTILTNTSNSINFIMYFISGHKFRMAAFDVIRCRWSRRNPRLTLRTNAHTRVGNSEVTRSVATSTLSFPSSPDKIISNNNLFAAVL